MPTHVIYIDDSGTKEYANDHAEYERSPRGKTRYFLFCGVLATTASAGILKHSITALKTKYFGTPDVEIKSNWLRISDKRQMQYLDKYRVSDAKLTEFVERYYTLILDADISLIAAVVDKKHTQQKYPSPWYAPAIAYELLLQRAQMELTATQSLAVIIDDMTGKTPKGNEYKRNLMSQHLLLKQRGGQLVRGQTFPCLQSQKFVSSALSPLIQVADVAAYNVYKQFVDHGENWEQTPPSVLPTYKYFGKIARKFRQDGDGRVQGYGVVKFPLLKRVQWKVRKK